MREVVAMEFVKRGGEKIRAYFPDEGPFRRELYDRHVQFFANGASQRERLMLAANRAGKSTCGAYEASCHLTGDYPAWWVGRRFTRPITMWAAGDRGSTTRDIVQSALVGSIGRLGTGMIPSRAIIHARPKASPPGAIDQVWVRHVSGGESQLIFKAYEQGRRSFEGTSIDLVWLDEEPPDDIYGECVIRTMTTNGIVYVTCTPLLGLTPFILRFQQRADATACVTTATWDNSPHLTEEAKADLLKDMPPYLRDARTKGIPSLGSGAVYPIPASEIMVQPFAIPDHWPKAYGLDVGWRYTAAAFGAWDEKTDTVFIWDTYKREQAEPVIHAEAVKARGVWIPGVCDPAAESSNQVDGRNLLALYRSLGLNLEPADNAVSSGIFTVWNRFATGRLKVFASCAAFWAEYPLYRRNERGAIVKESDHVVDSLRYLVVSGGPPRATTAPKWQPPTLAEEHLSYQMPGSDGLAWLSR